MATDPLDLIRKRRADIQEAIAGLSGRIERLREELAELSVAERVLSRLDRATLLSSEEEATTEPADQVAERLLNESPTISKPAGIPTMPDMIIEALRAGELFSDDGLEPKDIMKYIADHWWPDVRSELVGPIAWRMWKRGQIQKDGALYKLPQKNEAAGTPSESAPTASEPGAYPPLSWGKL